VLTNFDDPSSFLLGNGVVINLLNAKSKDFYWLFINKTYTAKQTGPKRWDSMVTLEEEDWNNIFKSIRIICKENRLKEKMFGV